jgi:hypothetical protein
MSNLHFESELAADLARKINNGEKLSWQEAQDFKYRVNAKMGEIQAYLTKESARLAAEGTTQDPMRGWSNEFQNRLNEINKLQASITAKKDIISSIATATEHERDKIQKLAQEGLTQFTGYNVVGPTVVASAIPDQVPTTSTPTGDHPGITNETRKAAMGSVIPSQESSRNSVEITATAYNLDFKKSHAQQLESALKLLESNKGTSPKLLAALKAFLVTGGHTYPIALALQKQIVAASASAKFSDVTSKAKWGPDGFFGPMSLAALEQVAGVTGTSSIPTAGPNPQAPAAGPTPRSKPNTKPVAQSGGSATPAAPRNPENTSDASVAGLYKSFKEIAKSIDTNWYAATPESRKTDNDRLMAAYTLLRQAIARLSAAEQKSVATRQVELELARYFDGGKDNSHHKNPTEALAINLKLLQDMSYIDGTAKKSFDWPTIPTETDINKALIGTSLMATWNIQVAAGAEPNAALGYLLGNPKFKGEYQKIQDKVYGEFEDKLGAMLEKARRLNDAGKLVSPSPELLSAMDHAANIVGNGWLTLSSSNLNKAISMGKGAALILPGAVVGWFGAALAWNPVGWGGVIAGSTMVTAGIAAMTYAGAYARGSDYATRGELTMETGIAALTLLPGVLLYRIPAVGAKAVAMGAKVGIPGLIVADYGANVAVGVSADQMRGLFHGTEVSFSSSLVQNLLFALAPAAGSAIANSARATALATRAQSSLARLGHLQRNGGTPAQVNAAAKEVEAVAVEAAPLRATAAAQAEWASVTPPLQTGEGGVTGAAAPKKPAATADGVGVKRTPSSVNSPKFNDALARDLSALPEGQSLNVADISIKREGNSFAVKKWDADAGSFENTATWRKALSEYVYSNTKPSDIIHAGLSKARMKGLKEVAGKEVIIDGQTYKVHQAGESGVIIQKQVAPGQFRNLSAAEMDALSPTELVGLTDHIYGPGKAALIEAQLKKSAEAQKDMVKKLDKITVKEFFFGAKTGEDYKWIGAKIPKYMYDWSIGRMARELKISLVDTPGLGKVEVLRTLVTGRSGHGKFLSAHGWTPGWNMLAKVGAVTVGETYMNALIEQNGDFSNALIWSLAPRNPNSLSGQEFLTNYINYTFIGGLGTLIIESTEALGLVKEWTIGAAGIVRNTLGRVGQDGQPIDKK